MCCSHGRFSEDEQIVESNILSFYPHSWQRNLEKAEKKYKKGKSTKTLQEWKNSISEINLIKNILDKNPGSFPSLVIQELSDYLVALNFTCNQLNNLHTKTPLEKAFIANGLLFKKILIAANEYKKKPSEENFSKWEDLVSQTPIVKDLILFHLIIDRKEQIIYLNSFISQIEKLINLIKNYQTEESLFIANQHKSKKKAPLLLCGFFRQCCLIHLELEPDSLPEMGPREQKMG